MTAPLETEDVVVGALRLRVPKNWSVLSSLTAPDDAWRLARSSPDLTLYHSLAYLDFARRHGGPCTLLIARRAGELLFGLPVHARSASHFTTGYSGVLLPREAKERSVRRSLEALFELIALNPLLQRVDLVQAAVSDGAADRLRSERIDATLTCLAQPASTQQLFSRVLELERCAPSLQRATQQLELAAAELDAQLLKQYDGDLRNQIRQGERHGVRLVAQVLAAGAADDAIADAYRDYLPIHRESWMRTGMQPHAADYWHALSRAVVDAGGVDLVVLAVADEAPVAAVTCHLFGEHAIYWSGASAAAALPKRANPLCLHAAISLCRRLGVTRFELGRFTASQDDKEESITRYKAQFGGAVVRVPNLHLERLTKTERARRMGHSLLAAIKDPATTLDTLRKRL